MRNAQKELKETGDLTISDAGYHQANMVDEIVSRVQDILPTTTTGTATDNIDAQIQQMANAAMANVNSTNSGMPQLVQQMQQMQTIMLQMQQQMATTSPRGPRAGNPRRPTGPRTGQPTCPIPASSNLYCWTHGRCSHTGQACENRAPGHKVEATQANRMGGSEWGCL